MYVPKTRKLSSTPSSRKTFTIRVVRDTDDFAFNVKFEVSSFPCGRIKLIARSAGLIITGDKNNLFKDITFDSIRSLYTCSGFSVLTPPGVVYAFCGRNSRRIW